ncbi:MAG TPA: hypothetical protein VM253_11080 [Candidatus Limnocylindrales bacterium]|nr:hypothetical protein [Candidatus Limnocylindrales bacterium]
MDGFLAAGFAGAFAADPVVADGFVPLALPDALAEPDPAPPAEALAGAFAGALFFSGSSPFAADVRFRVVGPDATLSSSFHRPPRPVL